MTRLVSYANRVLLIISVVMGFLAVARITRLLTDDELTNRYRLWVVKKWGGTSWQSYLAHCPWCTSFWVALPIMPLAALLPNIWTISALSIPAASMVAGLLVDRGK